jgi:iron complex transport system substrate-binding protein
MTDELLLALVEPERIVALSVFADDASVSNATEKAKLIANRVTGDAEQVVALDPDLVLITSYSEPEFARLMKASGICVQEFDSFSDFDSIAVTVGDLALMLGVPEASSALVADMQERLSAVATRVASATRPTVLPFAWGYCAGAGTTHDAIITAAGGLNPVSEEGIRGHTRVSSELLLRWDPDYVVTPGETLHLSDGGSLVQRYPELAQLSAFRNSRVIEIPARSWDAVSHHAVNAVEMLGKILHPIEPAQGESLP